VAFPEGIVMSHVPLLSGLPGGTELWIVLAIILLLFGRRIPQVARSLGQGISQFKKGLNEPAGEDEDEDDEEERPRPKKASAAKTRRDTEDDEG
jgi:sec-independent protein translocase protein TatA